MAGPGDSAVAVADDARQFNQPVKYYLTALCLIRAAMQIPDAHLMFYLRVFSAVNT